MVIAKWQRGFIVCCVLSLLAGCGDRDSGEGSASLTKLGRSDGVMIHGELSAQGLLSGVDREINSRLRGYSFRLSNLQGSSHSGLPTIQFTAYNKSSKKLNLQYRYSWYDKFGLELNPGTSIWNPIQLQAHAFKTISSTARAPGASAYRIYVRPLKFKKNP